MYVKFFPRDLNLNPYPLILQELCTCRVTVTPRVCDNEIDNFYSNVR